MRQVDVKAYVPGQEMHGMYSAICSFEDYPEYSTTVREVVVTQQPGSNPVSDWTVDFRQGILCWTEEDTLIPEEMRVQFHQLSGDMDQFRGGWVVKEFHEGYTVHFYAEVDLGIPSLSEMLEPIAAAALRENIQAIIKGIVHRLELTGVTAVFESELEAIKS